MAKRTQPARRPRRMAPAVLLLESSVVASEAGSPVASLGSGVSGAGAGETGEPCGREPLPDPPGGFAPCPPRPDAAGACAGESLLPLPSNCSRISSGDSPPAEGALRDGGTPPLKSGELVVGRGAALGFGSRGGAEIGRWSPARGTIASAVTQTGEASCPGAWRK